MAQIDLSSALNARRATPQDQDGLDETDPTIAPTITPTDADKTGARSTQSSPVLPHSLESEAALLGAVLRDNSLMDKIGEFLKEEHFYNPAHRIIWKKLRELYGRNQVATPDMLAFVLDKDPLLAQLQGGAYVFKLANNIVTIAHADGFARQLVELATRRELVRLGVGLINEARDLTREGSVQDLVDSAEQKIFSIGQEGSQERPIQTLGEAFVEAKRQLDEARSQEHSFTGVVSGFRALDDLLGGFQRSDLIIIAARPSMGKTALALNIAVNCARTFRDAKTHFEGEESSGRGGKILFFSLEMSSSQLAGRVLSSEARLGSDSIRRGVLSGTDYENLLKAYRALQDIPLILDDAPGSSVSRMAAVLRRAMRDHQRIDMVIVDYIQLIESDQHQRRFRDNRNVEVSMISRGLKRLAKEFNVPVIALSQLSREVESRSPPVPQLADLRDSGAIEQDADVVMFIYRPVVYTELKLPRYPAEGEEQYRLRREKLQNQMNQERNLAKIFIQKHRNGPTGTIELNFIKEITRFETATSSFPGSDAYAGTYGTGTAHRARESYAPGRTDRTGGKNNPGGHAMPPNAPESSPGSPGGPSNAGGGSNPRVSDPRVSDPEEPPEESISF